MTGGSPPPKTHVHTFKNTRCSCRKSAAVQEVGTAVPRRQRRAACVKGRRRHAAVAAPERSSERRFGQTHTHDSGRNKDTHNAGKGSGAVDGGEEGRSEHTRTGRSKRRFFAVFVVLLQLRVKVEAADGLGGPLHTLHDLFDAPVALSELHCALLIGSHVVLYWDRGQLALRFSLPSCFTSPSHRRNLMATVQFVGTAPPFCGQV